jgi:hypothetical protein
MINVLTTDWITVSENRNIRKIDENTYIEAVVGECIITFRGFEYCENLKHNIQTTNEYIARRDSAQAIIAAIDSVEREMDRADYSNQNRVDYQTRMQNIALSALHHINSTRLELA